MLRLDAIEDCAEPWPHSILDDCLPAEVFQDLLGVIGGKWDQTNAQVRKTQELPKSVMDWLAEAADDIEKRWGVRGKRSLIELAYRAVPLNAHVDRCDKLWSGLIYVAGDPKGTELYGLDGKLARIVEWKPNRLVAWTRPPHNQQHAVPRSAGRYVLAWWLLQ